MNKEYIQTGDMFVISTDKGLKKKERLNNTTEILESENNIEKMESIQDKIENKELFNYKQILESLTYKIVKEAYAIYSPIALSAVIVALITGQESIAAILFPTIFVCPSVIGFIVATTKASKSYNLMHVKANEFVETELENEKQKLEQLNKESFVLPKNDLGILNETIKITETKSIKNLKIRLNLIGDYELNKRKFTRYYENNNLCPKLCSKGYNKDSILVIEELIKNDIEEKVKVKTLKK